MRLQDRDYAVLGGLSESRVLTLAHLTALYFAGHRPAAKRRVRMLKAAGLLAERPRRPFEPSVLTLTQAGLAQHRSRAATLEEPALGSTTASRRPVSELMLRHELAVADVKAAVVAAVAREPRLELVEFDTRPERLRFVASRPATHGFGRERVVVLPDGYLRVRQNGATGGVVTHRCYVEVDRGTESLTVLHERLQAYAEHYRRGGFARQHGVEDEAYRTLPFRVLVVVNGGARRDNVAERLLAGRVVVATQVWLTTLAELTADPLGPVWVRPRDYRDAAAGMSRSAAQRGRGQGRRRPDWEEMVERAVHKQRLIPLTKAVA